MLVKTLLVKGRYTRIAFQKTYRERCGAQVFKVTKGVYRVGCDASHLAHYEHKGNGLQGSNQWHLYPFLIASDKGMKLRVYNTYNKRQRVTTDYFVRINGEVRPTTKEEALAQGWLVPSEVKTYGSAPDMFDIFLDNIIQIG